MTSITSIARIAATQVSEMCQGSPPFSLLTKRYSRTAKEIRARPGMGQPRTRKKLVAKLPQAFQVAKAPCGDRNGCISWVVAAVEPEGKKTNLKLFSMASKIPG